MNFFSSKVEPPLKLGYKAKIFCVAHWRGLILFLLPLILIAILPPFPPAKYKITAYTLILMALLWITECIPLPLTSLIPIVMFPLTNVMSTSKTCAQYMNNSVMLFLASLMMAYAVEQSGLHKRLAYIAIRAIGYSHKKLLFALFCVTTFVSFWISNTAATTMMVPINFAILKVFEEQNLLKIFNVKDNGEKTGSAITCCYFCSAAYAATVGGIGTLIASPTNLVFKGLFVAAYPSAPEYLSFPLFSAYSLPMVFILNTFIYFYLTCLFLGFMRPKSKSAKNAYVSKIGKNKAKKALIDEQSKLGKVTFWEIMVVLLFTGAMVMFFCRSPQVFKGWSDMIMESYGKSDSKFIADSSIGVLFSFLMCFLPSTLAIFKNCTAKHVEDFPKRLGSVLNWVIVRKDMPFSYALLLGGGFALSTAMQESGLNEKIGVPLKNLSNLPDGLILLILLLFIAFFTNFASNVVICNVFVPIAMQLAAQIGKNPLLFNIAAGFTSSFSFIMPIGTPGNLIVQRVARIPTKTMIIAGLGPTVFSAIMSWFMLHLWAPIIWPDIKKMPLWTKVSTPSIV